MSWRQRLVCIVGCVALGLLVPLSLAGCLDSTITNDDRHRCCTCLFQGECLEDGATVASCRGELTNDGSTEFDPDCETEHCGRECDFLYW